MKHFLRWVSPLILGVIEFYFLRLATDPSRGTEWWPDFNNQLRALLLTILLCYIVDYCLRNIFHKYIFRKEISIGKEYSYITLGLFITTNVTLSITYALGLIELGQPISDYILVNIIYVPLNVLYYTIIRNKEISNYYQHQSLLIGKAPKRAIGYRTQTTEITISSAFPFQCAEHHLFPDRRLQHAGQALH